MWAVFAFLVLSMTMIYASIGKVDNSPHPASQKTLTPQTSSEFTESRELQQESPSSLSSRQQGRNLSRLRREFATQALLYCIAFTITWAFATVAIIFVEWTDLPIYMPIVFLNAILAPLQGFWNAFIYLRPRYLRYRRKQEMERMRLERSNSSSRPASRTRVFHALAHALSVVEEKEGENKEGERGNLGAL